MTNEAAAKKEATGFWDKLIDIFKKILDYNWMEYGDKKKF